jgi:crotonobetainyl-CoA:carnitine CoA-transferase CaiB-like acyl-CoA transferase
LLRVVCRDAHIGAAPRLLGQLPSLRILDLTSVILGPYAAQILGDLGAEIVKVEPPESDTHGAAGGAGKSEADGLTG